jgi:hypothetical protein
MLKKIGYFYLIIAGLLLLTLLTGLAGGADTGGGFLLGVGVAVLVMFLIWTSPLLLLVLALLIGRKYLKVDSFKQLWARAERFHSGGG